MLEIQKDKQSLVKENQTKQNKILKLKSIIFDFNRKIFGKKSEKIDPQDLYYAVLFNEAEKGLDHEDKLLPGHSETIRIKSFQRKKAGRKPLPENIPREEIVHDIAESEKICKCGHELIYPSPKVISHFLKILVFPNAELKVHLKASG